MCSKNCRSSIELQLLLLFSSFGPNTKSLVGLVEVLKNEAKGGSSGIVVMGDNSCSKGRGFESQRCLLDGHLDIFSHWFVEKIIFFVRKEQK